MPLIQGLILMAVVIAFSIYRYWKWVRYLWWKWRAIPVCEQAARRAKGLCAGCGYDLRGTPERCPECGELTSSGNR